MRRYGTIAVSLILFVLLAITPVKASVPYQNYTYTNDGTPESEPQAYIPEFIITGDSLGTDAFSSPQDVFIALDGRIYIADTGNSRILVLSADFVLEKIIKTFENRNEIDELKKPCGLFVTKENDLYIADTDNYRIVILDVQGNLKAIHTAPDSPLLNTGFQPLKVVVDQYSRMFIVSRGCENGFIQLERDGSFSSYYGAIQTTLSSYDLFWRLFQTEEELSRIQKNIPTVYSNCSIDVDGFVYGTVSATGEIYNEGIIVRRLNPMGIDILKRDGVTLPIGDARVESDPLVGMKHSKFIDICTRPNEAYSVLDSVKNRIFTYDGNGNLLFVFGGYGERLGTFISPTALDFTADDKYLVVDGDLNQIVVFYPTEYAQLLLNAVDLQYKRRYDQAEAKWNEVLRYTTKSEVVYNNLGKIMLMSRGRYEKAMFYFRLGNFRELYSGAYKYLRKEIMNQYFSWSLLIIAMVIIVIKITRKLVKRKKYKS